MAFEKAIVYVRTKQETTFQIVFTSTNSATHQVFFWIVTSYPLTNSRWSFPPPTYHSQVKLDDW